MTPPNPPPTDASGVQFICNFCGNTVYWRDADGPRCGNLICQSAYAAGRTAGRAEARAELGRKAQHEGPGMPDWDEFHPNCADNLEVEANYQTGLARGRAEAFEEAAEHCQALADCTSASARSAYQTAARSIASLAARVKP
jgi:hypothetical protein